MSLSLATFIGLSAQLFFSARLLIQWIASEKAKKILSPTIFWQFSMMGSLLLCIYGWMRNDFAIILGQFISYYIYIWNLQMKGNWAKLPSVLKIIFSATPLVAVIYFLFRWDTTIHHLFRQENIPVWLIVFGVLGQFTFTLRFIYQWWYSRKIGESILPINFWLISLTGSLMIILYALIRQDFVLILGQATGFVVYIRNIIIGKKEKRRKERAGE